jgi:hypothetical protein
MKWLIENLWTWIALAQQLPTCNAHEQAILVAPVGHGTTRCPFFQIPSICSHTFCTPQTWITCIPRACSCQCGVEHLHRWQQLSLLVNQITCTAAPFFQIPSICSHTFCTPQTWITCIPRACSCQCGVKHLHRWLQLSLLVNQITCTAALHGIIWFVSAKLRAEGPVRRSVPMLCGGMTA